MISFAESGAGGTYCGEGRGRRELRRNLRATIRPRGYPGLTPERAREMAAAGEAYFNRDLRDALVRVFQKLFGLFDAVAVEISCGRQSQFLAKTTGQVILAQADVVGDVLP